jgi:hypothetical protein
VPLNIIQRQLAHANLGTTSIYLQGIDPEEIIAAARTPRADDVGQRRAATLSDRIGRRERSGAPALLGGSRRLRAEFSACAVVRRSSVRAAVLLVQREV